MRSLRNGNRRGDAADGDGGGEVTRIERIRAMPTEELAKLIVDSNVTDDFCQSDCGDIDDPTWQCNHAVECCVRWLNEDGEQ